MSRSSKKIPFVAPELLKRVELYEKQSNKNKSKKQMVKEKTISLTA